MSEGVRELTSHKVDGLNEALRIEVLDEPGPGNACHTYRIVANNGEPIAQPIYCEVQFQKGPIQENGVNGISNEALLAIVEHRLLGFQSGPFACQENAIALNYVQAAMMSLQKRTRDRMARGVEGTNEK